MLHVISSFVLVLIGIGLYYRRKPGIHFRLMLAAFVLDLALVIYIEATRHAVEKVATHFRVMLWVHASISLAMLACYPAMMLLGRRVLTGRTTSKAAHRNLGMAFVVLRLLNYVTAFAV